jgi:hypothetical protein
MVLRARLTEPERQCGQKAGRVFRMMILPSLLSLRVPQTHV